MGGTAYARIDVDLDYMIEENIKMQEEEQELMIKVRKLQKKKQKTMIEGSAQVKKLTSTLEGRPGTTTRSPDKKLGSDFAMDLQHLRTHIEKSNKTITELKTEIEFAKRASHGQIPSPDMEQTLRQKELQVA